eukprot:scaffold7523_cov30-Phaeocystis_antarctica.AAC.1
MAASAASAASSASAALAASAKAAKAAKIAAKTAANVPTRLDEKAFQAEDIHLGRFVRLSLKVGVGGSVRAALLTVEEELTLEQGGNQPYEGEGEWGEGDGSGDRLKQKRLQQLKKTKRIRESASRKRKKAYIEELEAEVAALKASVHQQQCNNHILCSLRVVTLIKQDCSSTSTNADGAIAAALGALQVVKKEVSELGLKPLVVCPADEGGADVSDAEAGEGEGEGGEGDSSGDPLEQKRLQLLQRNRKSSALSRRRKKAYIEALEAEVPALKASVHQLQTQNHTLKQEYCSWARD